MISREEDWKQTARARLRKFEEELQVAFEAGMKTYSGNTAWNFINGVIYSLTVVSTIGNSICSNKSYRFRFFIEDIAELCITIRHMTNSSSASRIWPHITIYNDGSSVDHHICYHWNSHISYSSCRFWQIVY